MDKRIVITGIGVVSPIGLGREAVWKNLDSGNDGFGLVSSFDTSNIGSKLAAEVDDLAVNEMLGSDGLKNLDRTNKMAICAARLVIEDSGIIINTSNAERIGVVFGTTNGSVASLSSFDKQTINGGPRAVNPALFPNLVMCSAPSRVAIRFGLKGMSAAVSAGFNSGYEAIKYATNAIRRGHVDHMLVGVVEELSEQTYKAFYKLGLLSGSYRGGIEHCAPVSSSRNGFVMGEGAVAFLVEDYAAAKKRSARIYAEVAGTYEDQKLAMVQSVRSYIRNLDKTTTDLLTVFKVHDGVDFISLGVNSSRKRDLIESQWALKLSEKCPGSPVSGGIKSLIGESFSAGYGFQILGALFCMDTNSVFKTAGVLANGDRSSFKNMAREPLTRNINCALVCSADMGTQASAILLKKV